MSCPRRNEPSRSQRSGELKSLYIRLENSKRSVTISDSEAQLLQEAILNLDAKEQQEAKASRERGRKPIFLPLVMVLSVAYFFGFFSHLFLSTTFATAIVASFIGLVVGIAAIKRAPEMQGYWLHDVD